MSTTNRRAKVVVAAFVVFLLGLLARLVDVQLVKWKFFEREAEKQHWVSLPLNARRGSLYDRRGRALTLNRSTCSIRILPQYVRDGGDGRRELAELLASHGLGTVRGNERELLKYDHMFPFACGVEREVGDSLRRDLVRHRFHNCTYVDDEYERIYPYGSTCANVVGFVGDSAGLAGLEVRFDSVLRGRSGSVLLQRDAVGHRLPDPGYPRREPVGGADIRLTLDADVQELSYRALATAVCESRARRASAVVLDARDGAVLALADWPSYDPVRFRGYRQTDFHCRAVCDEFEPGSSFKPVLGLAVLESPKARDLTRRAYDVSAGVIEVSGKKIRDVHRHGVLDFDGVFIKSSNPACVMMSLEVDPRHFYLTARALGFGSRVGIELPGEARGQVDRPYRLTALRLANNSFGQGLTVTLLQLAAGYLCVANDGVYLRPYLVEEVTFRGRRVWRQGKTKVRRAVSQPAARRMKDILARVVTEGTGIEAAMPGTEACGKTGTAQKVESGGGYSDTRAIMSFAGFFPKDEPRFVIAVMVDEPQQGRFASTVACPVFRRIGEGLQNLDLMRSRQQQSTDIIALLDGPGGIQ